MGATQCRHEGEHARQGPIETGEEENRIRANGAEPEEMVGEDRHGRVDEMEQEVQCRGEITGTQEQSNRRGGDRENQDYRDSGSVAAANDQELPILGIGEEQQDTHDSSLLEELYNLVVEADKEVQRERSLNTPSNATPTVHESTSRSSPLTATPTPRQSISQTLPPTATPTPRQSTD